MALPVFVIDLDESTNGHLEFTSAGKIPLYSARRSSWPNRPSTAFSYEALVGVK
jgi:hypothetical protein